METILIFLFFGWCLSSVVVNGSIFDEFRNYLLVKAPFFGKLFSCVMCLSVWIGALIFWTGLSVGFIPSIFHQQIPFWINYLLFPFLQSGVSVIIESSIIFLVKGAKSK